MTTALSPSMTGSRITSKEGLSLIKIIPPISEGATLSAWKEPSASSSAKVAHRSTSFSEAGLPKYSFIAKAPTTALAALLPRPVPTGMFFISSISIGMSVMPNNSINL